MDTSNNETATRVDAPPRARQRDERLEMLFTLIMAFAAIGTAWSGFESSSWGSVQSNMTSQANALRLQSNRKATEAGQLRTLDVITFTAWITAINQEMQSDPSAYPAEGFVVRENTGSGFLYARFRSEFKPVLGRWLELQPLRNPAAPSTPFVMPEYQLSAQTEADALLMKAELHSNKAQAASKQSSRYMLMGVIFALVLFFVAVGNKAKSAKSRLLLFSMSVVLLLGAMATLASFPVVL